MIFGYNNNNCDIIIVDILLLWDFIWSFFNSIKLYNVFNMFSIPLSSILLSLIYYIILFKFNSTNLVNLGNTLHNSSNPTDDILLSKIIIYTT